MKVIEKKDGTFNLTLTQDEFAELLGYADMGEISGVHGGSLGEALDDILVGTAIHLEYIKEK